VSSAKTTTKTPSKPRKQSKLAQLLRFDAVLKKEYSGFPHLIGLDEVGRGSLIDSVIGGAVCFPFRLTREQKQLLNWLDDSKKLTADVRAELSEAIHAFCHVGIGEASKAEIDQINIHYASLLALHRAFLQLCQQQQQAPNANAFFLIMDGRATLPDWPSHCQRAIVKGDGQSAAIAAASIVAKHFRDSRMKRLAEEYPGYGWEVNMGYPTPAHLSGLQTLGVTPLHRQNFRKVHEQLTLPI
jgi:ribonuclease HII